MPIQKKMNEERKNENGRNEKGNKINKRELKERGENRDNRSRRQHMMQNPYCLVFKQESLKKKSNL